METIDATVENPTVLRLSKPVNFPSGSKIKIVLCDADSDREELLEASAMLLAESYGPDEFEYTEAHIKKPNPGYRP